MLKDRIKNYIREVILELLEDDDIRPKFETLKQYVVSKHKKLSFFDCVEKYEFEQILIFIYYIDPILGSKETDLIYCHNIHEFKHTLETFKPKHPHFTEVTFKLEFINDFGKQDIYERFNSVIKSSNIYESSELDKIFKPTLEWVYSKSELLI